LAIRGHRTLNAGIFRFSDRLARSTFDLFAIVKRIVDAKAQFRSLAEPWADTGTSTGRLTIPVLGGLADSRARSYPHPHR
jgi:DNA invertase Pin-like site-specific DNA recombinase